METDLVVLYTALAVGVVIISSVIKRANGWFYALKFSPKEYHVPPGDMGWPFIGNMLFFFKSFKLGGDLRSFISYFVTRFGSGGMYKAFMFGKPSIIVTTPEICRKILMDDEHFDLGFPIYLKNLLGQEPPGGTTVQEDKLIRRLTTPIKTHGSLTFYFDFINKTVKSYLEKSASKEEPFVFVSEMKRPAFDVLMQILLDCDKVNPELLDVVFKENTSRFRGLHSLPINIPGFAYNRAIKARNTIVKVYQQIIDERKIMLASNKARSNNYSILDAMIDTQDDDEGKRLRDGNILKALQWFTFGGYESVARVVTQTVMNLLKYPDSYQIAKEEQEEIVRRRASPDSGLTFEEIGQMKYLSKVINETLRIGSTETVLFRDANTTVNINGYSIPKGWKFLTLLGNFHMDPLVYEKPKEFNPSRWDDFDTKPASYLPFGTGPKMCPGANIAKLEVSVFLHYILLYYRVEQINLKSKTEVVPENFIVRFKNL